MQRFLKTASQQIAQKQFSEVHHGVHVSSQKSYFFFEKASFYFSLFVDKALTDVNIGVCFNISVRCGPPYNVSFSRHSGGLVLNVNWEKEDIDVIKYYSVRYKALGSLLWSKVSIKLLLTPNICM